MERPGAGRPSPWLGPAPEASPASVDGHCGKGAARGSGEAPRLHHPHKERPTPAGCYYRSPPVRSPSHRERRGWRGALACARGRHVGHRRRRIVAASIPTRAHTLDPRRRVRAHTTYTLRLTAYSLLHKPPAPTVARSPMAPRRPRWPPWSAPLVGAAPDRLDQPHRRRWRPRREGARTRAPSARRPLQVAGTKATLRAPHRCRSRSP
jgi:hypothetical protein